MQAVMWHARTLCCRDEGPRFDISGSRALSSQLQISAHCKDSTGRLQRLYRTTACVLKFIDLLKRKSVPADLTPHII